MTFSWFELFACVAAVGEVVEVFHHGSIFAGLRSSLAAWLEFVASADYRPRPRWRLKTFAAEGLSCPYCVSVHAGWITVLLYWLFPPIVWALAASRLANVFSDVYHPACRTPGRDPPAEIEEPKRE